MLKGTKWEKPLCVLVKMPLHLCIVLFLPRFLVISCYYGLNYITNNDVIETFD